MFSGGGVGGTSSLGAGGVVRGENRGGRRGDAAEWGRRGGDKGEGRGAKCPGKKGRVGGGPWEVGGE